MNLEEALDFLIEQVENWRADTKGDYSYWDEFMLCTETLLRCADQEWQRRELGTYRLEEGLQRIICKIVESRKVGLSAQEKGLE